MGMIKDFKDFAVKGNMVDMAIGIVMGVAFGTVIKSLVDDVLMPIVSKLFNMPDFRNMFVALKDPASIPEGFTGSLETLQGFRDAGGLALGWGAFLNALIAFIFVALALWMVVKAVTKMQKAKEEEAAGPSNEEVLLTEIRDVLSK